MLKLFFCFFIFIEFSGCGYSWQNTQNKWKSAQVQSIYIKPVANNSMRSGAEVIFTSALIKKFSRSHRIKLVSNPSEADASLEGKIIGINVLDAGDNTVNALTNDPAASGLSDFLVATQYQVSAALRVNLIRSRDKALLWSAAFSSNKLYPSNNRFGLPGTTSVLINDTDMQMALEVVAETVSADLFDAMFEAY